jgi:hypothetical protein
MWCESTLASKSTRPTCSSSVLATRIAAELDPAATPDLGHDSSTNALIRRYRRLRQAADPLV